jgi:hypothetical protein
VIEQGLYFSLGFLVAALLALALAPAFWHRAVRLVTRKLELQIPLSAREVLAGRDLVRAELAVEQRKLEQKVEVLGALHARDMAEIGRRTVAVAAKDAELDELREHLARRDAEIAELRTYLAEATNALDATTAALHDANANWGKSEAELRDLRLELAEKRKLCAEQAEELAELERERLHFHESRIARIEREVGTVDGPVRRGEPAAALARLGTAAGAIVEECRRDPSFASSEPDRGDESLSPLASDPDLRRAVDSLVADLLAYRDAGHGLDSSRPEPGCASATPPTDERLRLRKRISEVGAMALRSAGRDRPPGPEPREQKESNATASVAADRGG